MSKIFPSLNYMEKTKYLIVGGGIAGTTAAETIRAKDAAGRIVIISDEPYRPYSRIMLSKPNFFLEKIPFDRIWLKKELWYEENRINFISGKKVIRLDPKRKIVILHTKEQIEYEKLLLAIGTCARRWEIPGSEKHGIFYLRTLDDAMSIIAAVKSAKAKGGSFGKALAVGGGFVCLEMCDMLRLAGIEVTLAIRESYYWEPLLDKPSGRMIESALERGGVKILRNTEVKEVQGKEAVSGVVFGNGTLVSCGIIIVGIGVVCPHEWIREAGIHVSRGVVADEYLQTSAPDVWTAGDAAEFNDVILGERIQLGNWVNAQMQGKAAGANMVASFGLSERQKEPFRFVSFYTTQGFGITIAFIGDIRQESDRAVISRGNPESGSYGRIIIKDGEVVGGTLINRTTELSAISRLIENNTAVSGLEQKIADAAFDLKNLSHDKR